MGEDTSGTEHVALPIGDGRMARDFEGLSRTREKRRSRKRRTDALSDATCGGERLQLQLSSWHKYAIYPPRVQIRVSCI